MRKGLITIGILALILGLAALASGIVGRSFVLFFWGAILLVAIVFERSRYKKIARKSPGPDWQRTPERFVDDETGKMVTVYVHPESGERAYVEE